jgi:hypothetical protein
MNDSLKIIPNVIFKPNSAQEMGGGGNKLLPGQIEL